MKHFYACFLLLFVALTLRSAAVHAQCPVAAACTPAGASAPQAAAFGMGILNVTLGTINNTTVGNNPASGTIEGYRDYSCTQGTSLVTGLAYPISIQTNTSSNENVRVWLDWNNDGTFNPTTELIFASANARLHTGSTTPLPLAAVTGQPLRLRVAADAATSPLPAPCSTPQYSQVEDYRVTLLANTQRPVSAFAVNTAQACAGTFAFIDQSTRLPQAWRWTFGDGTSSTQQQPPSHTYAAPGTYTVQLRACNAIGCDSSQQTVTVFAAYPAAASCQPATLSYCCNYGITRLDFGAFSQASADGQAGYEDFTCARRFTVGQGQVLPLHVTTNQPQDTWVFLDANNDGVFATGELLYQALNRLSPQDFVTIPRTTLTNQPLRLRIISDAIGNANGAQLPCAARTSGQVEDYAVVVTPAPCPATVQAGQVAHIFSAGNDSSSPADSVASALLVTGYSPGASVQWERSRSAVPVVWQAVAGATRPTRFYTRRADDPDSLYRAAVTCAGTTVYTAPVSTVHPQTAMGYRGCSADYIQRVALTGTLLDNASTCTNTQANGYRLFNPTRPTQTATVLRGETYQLLVSTLRSSRVVVFVGTQARALLPVQDVITAPNGAPTSVVLRLDSLQIPPGTPVLLLRLRCVDAAAYSIATRTIAFDEPLGDGETEDYVLRVAPFTCADPVVSGQIAVPATPQCARDFFTLRVQGFTPGAALQWQSAPDSVTWQNVAATRRGELTTRLQATTYYRVQVQGCVTGAVTPVAVVRLLPLADCYCTLTTAIVPATAPVIARVRLVGTTLDNVSAATPGGPGRVRYAPTVPSQTAEVVRGGTYTLALTVANAPATGAAVHAAAWLDLDRNGAYDSLEWVHLLRTPAVNGSIVYQATLPVAASAQLGATALRLRVGNDVSYRPNQACGSVTPAGQGETEDYTVTIIAPPCGPAFTAGTINPTPSPNGRTRLRSIAYTLGADLQWQRSLDSLAWTDIGGAVTDEYPVWFVSAHYYRLRAQCGGATAYSRAVQATRSALPVGCVQLGPQVASADFAYLDEVEISGTPLVNVGSRISTNQWYRRPYDPTSPQAREAVGYWPPQQQGFTATLVRGSTYTLRLVGVGTSFSPTSVGAWIDWNQDGTFAPNEFYGQLPTAAAAGRVSYAVPITVPAAAALGTVLLRVRTAWGVLSNDGCLVQQGYTSSEAEDYLLTVADQPSLTVPTLAASLCPGQPLRLESTGAGTGATYRWLGPNGFQATGAVATRAAFSAADAGTYMAVAERAGERLVTSLYVPAAPPCLPVVSAAHAAQPRSTLSIYPTPTTGRCTVQFSVPLTGPVLSVTVRTVTGQLAGEYQLSIPTRNGRMPAEAVLDLGNRSAGLYFLEVHTTQGNLFGKVVVE